MVLILLRAVFGILLFAAAEDALAAAGGALVTGDLRPAYHTAVLVVLGLANAIVWAPLAGAWVSQPITSTFTDGHFVERPNSLMRALRWACARGWRRLAVALAFLHGVIRPDEPASFMLGMRQARPGSRLERIFALEVYRFHNIQHCVEARDVLKRHGIDPGPHPLAEVNLALASTVQPERPPAKVLPVPKSDTPLTRRRNRRIRLFAAAESDPATAPREHVAGRAPTDSVPGLPTGEPGSMANPT